MPNNRLNAIFRSLWKHRVYSLINLIGLTIGLCASFLIYLYVSYESGYDAYHEKADRIYRLVLEDDRPEGAIFGPVTAAMGPTLKMTYPEVEQVADVNARSLLVSNGRGVAFEEDNILYASPNLFSVFSFQFVKGDPNTALSQPSSIVLSETASRKYFGSSDPMGQSLQLNGRDAAKITGVIRDMPGNAHFRSDILVSDIRPLDTATVNRDSAYNDLWNAYGGETYLLLPDHYDLARFQPKLTAFMDKNAYRMANGHNSHYKLLLEPLKKVYLHGKFSFQQSGNINNVYIFSVVALFILFIACINFINLTTARAVERAKETGVRKIMGSSRMQLIRLFLSESLLLTFCAFLTACILCAALIPAFDQLCGKTVSRGLFEHFSNIGILFLLSLFLGLAAGIYPAIMLSSFNPVTALKGHFPSGKNRVAPRQILVVLQFAISIVLIVGTLVIYLQLNYMRTQPLGFKKDQMLVINFNRDAAVQEHIEAIKQDLRRIPGVFSASASSGIPNSGYEGAAYQIKTRQGTMQSVDMSIYMIDNDFLSQFQIDVLAGRGFSKDFPGGGLIVNETALKRLGYRSPADIIGKPFTGEGGHGAVIGVVRDFHFRSLQEQIQPLIFLTFFRAYGYLTLNIASGNAPSTISAIAAKWKQLAPKTPFIYFFLDEAIDQQYKAEVAFGKLFLYFGIFAVLVASLGLLGLTLFSTTQRTKEIAVRKVMGAAVMDIVGLLTKDMMKLILIAFVIASPIASLAMTKWLQTFAYRINIPWWTFLLTGGIALIIAALTVGFQTIKSAIANPVKNLRAE